jgi:SulP family sulfate permease
VALFATPLISPLPKAALGVIVVTAAMGLLDIRAIIRLRVVRPEESLLALVTLMGVLLFGILGGLTVAVGLSIGVFVYRSVRPHDATLGTIPNVDGYHDISRHENAATVPGLIVYRFDAALYFANSMYFKDRILAIIDETDPRPQWLLINAEAITYIDSTAIDTLYTLYRELQSRDIVLAMARTKGPIRDILEPAGLTALIGSEHFFTSVSSGVQAYLTQRRSNPS